MQRGGFPDAGARKFFGGGGREERVRALAAPDFRWPFSIKCANDLATLECCARRPEGWRVFVLVRGPPNSLLFAVKIAVLM
jgi:hypothetical protein